MNFERIMMLLQIQAMANDYAGQPLYDKIRHAAQAELLAEVEPAPPVPEPKPQRIFPASSGVREVHGIETEPGRRPV